jgi:Putative enzyme of poly-gamma-glutamate biosynthesis (capsule formation)
MKKAVALILLAALMLPSFACAGTLTLTFAGDCTLGADAPNFNNKSAFPALIEENGYEYPFKNVKHLFENDDLTMVNLEGVLSDDKSDMKKGVPYHFRGPAAYAKMLPLASIEAVNLGNNHTKDFGFTGLQATKDALAAENVGYCIDQDIYYFEKDGIKIAVLGFFYSHFTMNRDWMATAIPALKREQGVHFVVAHLHAGEEYSNKHSKKAQTAAYRLIDLGVDLVIGHHPHVLQGLEIYKDRTIVYSLGNFSFGGTRTPKKATLPTMVAQFEIEFEGTDYISQQMTIYPARCTGYDDDSLFQPVLVEGEEAEAVMKIIQKDTKFALNPFVAGVGAVQEPVKPASN